MSARRDTSNVAADARQRRLRRQRQSERVDPLTVPCAFCGAERGQLCAVGRAGAAGGKVRVAHVDHAVRVDAAYRLWRWHQGIEPWAHPAPPGSRIEEPAG